MSMKKHFSVFALSATTLFTALVMAAPANAQVVLNVNNWAGPTYPLATEAAGLCEDIKAVTEGRVVCNILPKPVATPAQTFDAVADGIVDIGYTVHGYTEGRFVLTKAVEFPLLGDSAENMSVAYQRVYESMMAGANEHEGVKVLAVHVHGPGQIFNIRKEIKTISDLNGLKMRVGGGVLNDVVGQIGVVPILKAATEVYELLQTGVADGVFFAKDGVVPYNMDEVAKFATFVPGGMYNLSFGWFANEDKWNSIPEADRALIEPLLGEALARRLGAKFDEADEVAPGVLAEAGIPVHVADEAFLAELAELTEPLRLQWFEDAKALGVDGEAVLEALRTTVAELEAEASAN